MVDLDIGSALRSYLILQVLEQVWRGHLSPQVGAAWGLLAGHERVESQLDNLAALGFLFRQVSQHVLLAVNCATMHGPTTAASRWADRPLSCLLLPSDVQSGPELVFNFLLSGLCLLRHPSMGKDVRGGRSQRGVWVQHRVEQGLDLA